MTRNHTVGLIALCSILFTPPISAQIELRSETDYSNGVGSFPHLYKIFKSPVIPEVDMSNSPRLDQLVREGKLYLSLNDALALAIENNLDIASARYGPKIAQVLQVVLVDLVVLLARLVMQTPFLVQRPLRSIRY